MVERDYKKDKAYCFWLKLMQLGDKTGCHQNPERSFYFRGYQMPVCARCTGVILGYFLALPVFICRGFHFLISALGCLIMLTDWLLQAVGVMKSNNLRRFITGILGGFGIMSIQIYIIKRLFGVLGRGPTKQ